MRLNSLSAQALGVSAIALLAMAGTAPAFAQFIAPDASYAGRLSAAATEDGEPILAGTAITISGQGFKPGQEVVLSRGELVLNPDAPVVADGEGKFTTEFQLPADAAVGTHPVVVEVANPSSAAIFELKISPDVPLSGEDKFTQTTQSLVRGLYQAAYSPKNNTLFVTSAVGRPPVKQSELVKLDADTLEIVARTTPAAAPARPDGSEGGVFAVYGVDVDDAKGTVWVTNTRQNAVAVYNQDDLSLVKQFEPGSTTHARDVVVDAVNGKAYVSATTTADVMVIDTETLEIEKTITIASNERGGEFSVGSLQLDAEAGKLYTVSLSTNEAAVIDLATEAVEKVFALPGAKGSIGVGHDAKDDLLFVASQGSDNLLIVDVATETVLHDVPVGAGALNVEYEPESGYAYVSNRGAGTVTVVDKAGNIVANLDNGSNPNYVVGDGQGNIYAINKSSGEDDPQGDRITRIAPAS